MRSSTAAKRFAKALMEAGIEDNASAKYGQELSTAAGVFNALPELYGIMLNRMYRLEERNNLMDKISGSLNLSPAVARFLNILVGVRRIELLDAVIEAYTRIEDSRAGRVRAIVETPFDLSQEVMEEIKDGLERFTGKEVILRPVKNPSLIGGIVIRMDNTVMDGSLKTQLEMMREKIMEGVAIA
ncbi:MAG: ATP synthase F1 subunit delta [Deltaproteobacteria bacterium]|nr:ATP synthase F1 subunit delta [Deltaproteobacteria bacterium]